MSNQLLPPQTPEQASTLYACHGSSSGTFDGAPLLQEIMDNSSPAETVRAFDEAMLLLSEYLIKDGSYSGLHYVNIFYHLRNTRNAIMKGAGFFDFEN